MRNKPVPMEHPNSAETILVHPVRVEHLRSLGWKDAAGDEPVKETDKQPEEIES